MTYNSDSEHWLAFCGTELIAEGELHHVAARAKDAIDRGAVPTIQFFEAQSSRQIDLDFSGSLEDVLDRIDHPVPETPPAPQQRTRGRPRLGVVAREVTLLPRHWEWLSRQPGGASVNIRKLIETARRGDDGSTRLRGARDRLYAFMSPVAGDLAGFEEASRALFAGDGNRFQELIKSWPGDVRRHLTQLAVDAFPGGGVS
jgi:hypothetical protein